MPSVHEWTEPLARWCHPVPGRGPGTCPVCRGCPGPGWTLCWSCARVLAQVSRPCRQVVPVTLYRVGTPLHAILRCYKDTASSAARRRHATTVAALLGRHLFDHGRCLGGGRRPWDVITVVPSTSGGAGDHPMVAALSLVPWLASQHRALLARTGAGLGHLRAADDAFAVTRPVAGWRVVVVDDTYTSGARAQSAASALALAGATVVAVVPVGRLIDPSWRPHRASWWNERSRETYSFSRCCLEADREPDPACRPGNSVRCRRPDW